jgi:hypothetical protein
MFAITKSTIQTALTVATATAVTGLLTGAIAGGAVLVATIGISAGVGYLTGKTFDWLRARI